MFHSQKRRKFLAAGVSLEPPRCRSSQRRAVQQRPADTQQRQATPHSFAQRLLKRTETASGSAGGRGAGTSAAMQPPTPQRSRAEAETDLVVAKIDDVLMALKDKPAPDTTALAALDVFRVQLSKQVGGCHCAVSGCAVTDCAVSECTVSDFAVSGCHCTTWLQLSLRCICTASV